MTLPNSLAPQPCTTPNTPAPTNACDSHIHMLAAADEAPLYAQRVEDPAPGWRYADYLSAYRAQMQALGITRTVVVQSIFYGTDNTITARATADLGPNARAIGLVPDGAPEAALDTLAAQNFKGIRLNYVHGGVLTWAGAQALAPALAARDMHIQMLLNADKHMAEIADDIAASPVPIVLDHIAWPNLAAGPADPGFQTLLRLLDTGNLWVKLSGLYRLSPAPYDATDALVNALIQANPERLLWGSDWPHIMLADAEQPNSAPLLDTLTRTAPSTATRAQILTQNPAALYGF